jgi:solute carrier family 6 amino acid transporter-like protein 5/7/9/14
MAANGRGQSAYDIEAKNVDTSAMPVGNSKETALAFGEDENKERGNWTGKLDFILSCVGFAVGLGNVWRFPYLCYRNGGGAFLIPYAIMLALAGLPLFFFELSLGQFSSKGPISVWAISPAMKGLGWGMIIVSGLVCIYYNMVIAYIIFYFAASLTSELPWSHCNNWYNTGNCTVTFGEVNLTASNITDPYYKPVPAAEEYWKRYVLDISDGIDQPGELRWQLALCLLGAWVVVFFCLVKGIKSTGKVWGDAAIQIFYSLGPAWGGLITMASYNRFNNNCYRDALIVAITNCGTSVFAGFVIFSVIGYMAHEMDVPVGEVTDSGPGLAFIAYPAGIALMPIAPLWSVLFFFMLFTLGLDSMFAMMETVITALSDEWTLLREHKSKFTLVVCIIGFFLGLSQCTQGGFYLLHLMDWYSAGFSLLFISLFEIVTVIHVYGYNRFEDDIRSMIGFAPNFYWRFTWKIITPIVLIGIIVFNAWQHVPCYLDDYVFPDFAQNIGWLMVVFAIMWIPIFAIKEWWAQARAQGFRRTFSCPWTGFTLSRMLNANEDWHPFLPEHQKIREDLTNKCVGGQEDLVEDNGLQPPSYNGYHNSADQSKDHYHGGADNPAFYEGETFTRI